MEFEVDYYGNNYEGTFTITSEEIMEMQRKKHIQDLKILKKVIENKVEPLFNGNEPLEKWEEWIKNNLELIYSYIEETYEEEICGKGYNHR